MERHHEMRRARLGTTLLEGAWEDQTRVASFRARYDHVYPAAYLEDICGYRRSFAIRILLGKRLRLEEVVEASVDTNHWTLTLSRIRLP